MGRRERRRFTDEFKTEVVDLVRARMTAVAVLPTMGAGRAGLQPEAPIRPSGRLECAD
jgi:hypothetical protein